MVNPAARGCIGTGGDGACIRPQGQEVTHLLKQHNHFLTVDSHIFTNRHIYVTGYN